MSKSNQIKSRMIFWDNASTLSYFKLVPNLTAYYPSIVNCMLSANPQSILFEDQNEQHVQVCLLHGSTGGSDLQRNKRNLQPKSEVCSHQWGNSSSPQPDVSYSNYQNSIRIQTFQFHWLLMLDEMFLIILRKQAEAAVQINMVKCQRSTGAWFCWRSGTIICQELLQKQENFFPLILFVAEAQELLFLQKKKPLRSISVKCCVSTISVHATLDQVSEYNRNRNCNQYEEH